MALALPIRSAIIGTIVCSLVFASGATAAVPAAAVSSEASPLQADQFATYVNAVREQFDVPGIAVAIVKDGKVVLAEGYGVRDRESAAPVDAHTLFAIASNTKAFTAAAISMLADQGKLDTDDRVIEHLPWFRMSEPFVTHEMRIKDLLSHRSGLSLGAGDLLYWPTTDYTTREVVEHLAKVPLANGLRSGYAYDNILFAVAELVIEAVSGLDYADFLRTHIFEPLGMSETRINYLAFRPGDDNVATGYAKYDFSKLKPVEPLSWHNNSGAGGIYSSVHDMAKWLIVQLNQGVYGPADEAEPLRLFSEERQQEMWSVLTPIQPREPKVPELAPATPNFAGYGEGWHLSDYRGHKLVWHTGGWPGFVSRVTLVPELELGMVVLTNQQSSAAFQALTYRVLDQYMQAPTYDWIGAYVASNAQKSGDAEEDWQEHLTARDENSKPSLALATYAGTYRDPWYGKVELRVEDGHLVIQFAHTAQLLGDLEHWQHDTFIVRWRDRSLNADAFLTFALNPDGKIREVRMEPISPLTDFSFDFEDLRLTPVAEATK